MDLKTFKWNQDGDGIVTLTMDDPTGSANVMNEHYIESMGKAVEHVVAEKDSITGIVITSAKKRRASSLRSSSAIRANRMSASTHSRENPRRKPSALLSFIWKWSNR